MRNNIINFRFSEEFIPAFNRWLSNYLRSVSLAENKLLFLTPTRRSAKKLKEKITGSDSFAAFGGDYSIQCLPVFDLGSSACSPDFEHEELGKSKRTADAAKMVIDYFKDRHPQNASQSLAVARDLLTLMDQMILEEVDIRIISSIVPPELSIHFQENLDFLKHVIEMWPKTNELVGITNEQERINNINQINKNWIRNPLQYPVFAIGINGAYPSINRLLKTVSELPFGHVVLYGADPGVLSHPIRPSSPQYSFHRLFKSLDIGVNDVVTLPTEHPSDIEEHINAALSSVACEVINDIPSITIIECDNPQEEAAVNALIIRETSPVPMLISAGVSVIFRIQEILKLFDFNFDNSYPDPISKSPEFTILRQTAEVISGGFATYQTIEMLKKVFLFNENIFEELVSLELRLRGKEQKAKSFLREASKNSQFIEEKMPNSVELINDIIKFVTPLSQTDDPHPLSKWVEIHRNFISLLDRWTSGRIQNNVLRPGSDISNIWDKIDNLIFSLRNEMVSSDEYVNILCDIFWIPESKAVGQGEDPQKKTVCVLGAFETRLLNASAVIIPDTNEGTWPPAKNVGQNLFNQKMLNKMGICSHEKKIELFGLEFTKALCSKNVILSRSKMLDGIPTQPSRWLVKLMSSLENNAEYARKRGDQWLDKMRNLTYLDSAKKILPPSPISPVSISELSLGDLCTLFSNPYEIYAKHILKLVPYRDLWEDASGILSLRRKISGQIPYDGPEKESDIQQFKEKRLLEELNDFQGLSSAKQVLNGVDGSITLDLVDGNQFKIKTKFDQVHITCAGQIKWDGIEVISYKGSTLAGIADIKAGLDLKTNLQIIIAHKGISTEQNPKKVDIRFLHLDGGINPIKETLISGDLVIDNQEKIIKKIKTELEKLITSRAYPAKPHRLGPYSHLARVKEWSKTKLH